MARYVLIVETNALPGTDLEFNRWYTHEHLSDVLALQGFTAAERFRLLEFVAPAAHRYLAVYEMDTSAPVAVMKALETAGLPLSPTLDRNLVMHLYESISERQIAPG